MKKSRLFNYFTVYFDVIQPNRELMSLQFINDANGNPAYVVIPYEEYQRNETMNIDADETKVSTSLLSTDGLYVTLPHGGPGAKIDLRRFIDAWVRRGTNWVVAISKRQQAYDKFENELKNGLDAILRRCFLPPNSPYMNTMQATTAVVDALVETGVFRYSIEKIPGYYRAVQCIHINVEEALEFLEKNGHPENPLDVHFFVLPY